MGKAEGFIVVGGNLMSTRTRAIKNSPIPYQNLCFDVCLEDLRSVGWNFAGYL